MRRLLVTGAAGMLGHRVMTELSSAFQVIGTARREVKELSRFETIQGDLRDHRFVGDLLERVRPDVIVNCAGVIKQRVGEVSFTDVCLLNTMLPHALACWCEQHGARLVHISSDCVFRGDRNGPPYAERDLPDVNDLYGYSKAAGEVSLLSSAVTLRTSIIGRETGGTRFGLLEWFLSQPDDGVVRGFRNHWWSGVTTLELARVIRNILETRPSLSGLYHVASAPIAKYDLLRLMADVFGRKTRIESFDSQESVYRVLDGARLRAAIDYSFMDLPHQMESMCLLEKTS